MMQYQKPCQDTKLKIWSKSKISICWLFLLSLVQKCLPFLFSGKKSLSLLYFLAKKSLPLRVFSAKKSLPLGFFFGKVLATSSSQPPLVSITFARSLSISQSYVPAILQKSQISRWGDLIVLECIFSHCRIFEFCPTLKGWKLIKISLEIRGALRDPWTLVHNSCFLSKILVLCILRYF